MELVTKDGVTYTIPMLRKMIRESKTPEERALIRKLMPIATAEERAAGHRRLDDGIYDSAGNLIGEKHPYA